MGRRPLPPCTCARVGVCVWEGDGSGVSGRHEGQKMGEGAGRRGLSESETVASTAVDDGRESLLSLSLTSHGSQIALSPLPRHSLTLTTLFSLGSTTWIHDAWRWDGTCSV